MGKRDTKQQGGALDIAIGVLLSKLAILTARWFGKGVRRLAYRWRRALTPVMVGFFVWVVAALWHALADGAGWWTMAALPIAGGLLAYFGPVLNERWSLVASKLVPLGLDRGRTDVLDRPAERIYFASLWTVVGVYLAIRSGFGPSEFTAWWWRIGLAVLGGLWWWHRRIRSAGRAEKIARKWAKIRDRDRCPDNLRPIAGAKLLSAQSKGRTAVLHVELPEALGYSTVFRVMEGLHSFYKARPKSIFLREDPSNTNRAYLTFMPRNPWDGALEHPAPEVGTYSIRSLGRSLDLGLYSDGETLGWEIAHAGVYGQTGGGKSGFIHSIMRWIVGATDALVVGIDMAGGATLSIWKRCLALPLATDLHSATVVLESVLRFIETRERKLGIDGDDDGDADEFEPTDQEPWLFLIIDEFPDLIAAAKMAGMKDAQQQISWQKYINGLLGRIAKKARKTGVRLIVGTQNPTKEDVGTTEFRGQLQTTIGLNLSQQQNRNLWGEAVRAGWSSLGLGEGQFMLQDKDHQEPRRAKGWWVPRQERRHAAAKAAELVKMAEPEAWDALMGTQGAVVIVPGQVVPKERDAILRALDESSEGVLTVKELMAATKLSRAQVYKRLKGLGEGEEPRVRALGGGRFARTGDTRVPVASGRG